MCLGIVIVPLSVTFCDLLQRLASRAEIIRHALKRRSLVSFITEQDKRKIQDDGERERLEVAEFPKRRDA